MRSDQQGKAFRCAALVAAALALTACVPSAYVYDLPALHHPGYRQYYATPGYYSYSPYPPRVVYYDHDHRGDDYRHPSHRDGRADRRPHGDGPAMPPPQWRSPPRVVGPEGPGVPPQARPVTDDRGAAPNKRRPPAEPRPDEPPRGMRALRVKQPADADKKSGARKELD